MVDGGVAKHIEHRACSARLRLGRTIDHGIDARMQHGAAAHGARLQRHIQGAAIEPVVAQLLRRSAQCLHFGMGRRVIARERGIAPLAYHLPIFDHHGPHGHFARSRSLLRQLQRVAHPVFVVRKGNRHGPELSLPVMALLFPSAQELEKELNEHRIQNVDKESPHHGHNQKGLV